MKNFGSVILSISVCACLGIASSAIAKPDHAEGNGKSHKSSKHYEKKHEHKHDHKIVFKSDELVVIRERLSPYYQKQCPPGLAKKHNGCLPPGQAKKYRVGRIYTGAFWDVPEDVLELLPAAPHGSRYIWVDRDILLISEATKKIIDATVILSAL